MSRDETGEKKLFLGGRLKRLRRELNLTQTRMAEDLGVSPSYLNLLERNQRPLTAQVLLRLAETYDLDIKSLWAPDTPEVSDLGEVFADPIFADLGIPKHEIAEVASNAPGVAEALLRLYQSHAARKRLSEFGLFDRDDGAPDGPFVSTPTDWVRDYIQAEKNYFSELEERAEQFLKGLNSDSYGFATAATAWLAGQGIRVSVVPSDVLGGYVHRFDRHRKRLLLDETLTEAGRAFAIACLIAHLENTEFLNGLVQRAAPPDPPAATLLKVSLANYLAAAMLMPYAAFQAASEALRYDINALAARFATSFEQVCHRLTTMSRPGARGIPFFMLRVDSAGNFSKRFAGSAFPFSRFGGTCPRWNIHASFKTPGQIVTQIVETPDGARYFTFARTVRRIGSKQHDNAAELAVGMGCEIKYASRLAYARGIDLTSPVVTAIGPACRICDRVGCAERADAPLARALVMDDFSKSRTSYPFAI
jgi:predicted transcriptional regulator/transcriptional regulator with XRE-family HTH domain